MVGFDSLFVFYCFESATYCVVGLFETLGSLDDSTVSPYPLVFDCLATVLLCPMVGFDSWRKRGKSKISWRYITQEID